MKRYLVFLLLFGLIAALTVSPRTISAKGPIPPEPEVWEWYAGGVSGEEIPMDTITTTPREWYQLKANGLKVDGATKICHGFDAGRYGWTGEIFRLVGEDWVKLTTTVGWVPTEEGSYMACAMAPAAGNYALFGYFDTSKAPVREKVLPKLPKCYSYDGWARYTVWDPPTFALHRIEIEVPESAFVPITYTVINSNVAFSGDLTATEIADVDGFADFGAYRWKILGPYTYPVRFTLHIETPQCYIEWVFTYDEDPRSTEEYD